MSRQSGQIVTTPIDRKVAAAILSISQRTLDRYIKSRVLISRKAKGRVWLDKEEVEVFKRKMEGEILEEVNAATRQHRDINEDEKCGVIIHRQGVSTLSTPLSTSTIESEREKVLSQLRQQVMHNDRSDENGMILSYAHPWLSSGESVSPSPLYTVSGDTGSLRSAEIYQKLYEDLKSEHAHAQKRLDVAHYRVGQLEAHVATMVPLLEYRKLKDEHKRLETGLYGEVKKRDMQLKKARVLFLSERMNKWVFAALVFILLGLQPVLWLISR